MMVKTAVIVVAVLFAACTRQADVPSAQTFVISEPEVANKPEIGVRQFDVAPDTVRRGEAVTVTVGLKEPYPARKVTLDWHGPDGWLIGYEAIDTTKTDVTVTVPAKMFDDAGAYRAVLRSGGTNLAEESITVSR